MTGIKEVAKVDGKRYLGKDGTRKLKASGDLRATVCGLLGLAFENKGESQSSHESPASLGGERFNDVLRLLWLQKNVMTT